MIQLDDRERLITIAQTYSFIKGEFTAKMLYDFIMSNNYKFRTNGLTSRQIKTYVGSSKKFKITNKNGTVYYYEAIK